MKRFHVHVAVHDLDQSVRFYSTLFGTAPTIKKDDYAKWMLDDPRINFAISTRAGKAGIDHLGMQAETSAELEEVGSRLLLLCEERQVLDRRPPRHRLGVVPHLGLGAALWQ